MPQIRISEKTKAEVDLMGHRLLGLSKEGAAVRVTRNRTGDFVSTDEIIALALRSLDRDIIDGYLPSAPENTNTKENK